MRPVARALKAFSTALDSLNGIAIPGLLLACVLLTLGHVPLQQNADGLLPTIMSLQRLTFYYWEQDRFANLLPLLTAWIGDPTHNLFAQVALRVAAGMVAPVFFTGLLFRHPMDAWRAALAADGLLLLTRDAFLLRDTFTVATPYGTSLACAGLATLAFRTAWRTAGWRHTLLVSAGTIGLLAAYTVNIALTIVSLPLLAIMVLLRPAADRIRLLSLHTGAAFVAALCPMVFAGSYPTPLGLHVSASAMGASLAALTGAMGWGVPVATIAPTVLALLAHRYATIRRPMGAFCGFLAATTATGAIASVVIGSSDHVRLNDFGPRYFVPVLLMGLAVAGAGLWTSCRLTIRRRSARNAAFILLAGLMLIGARSRLMAFGPSRPEVMETERAPLAREVADRAVSRSADAIVGDYWDVWPAVFVAAQHNATLGGARAEMLGIAPKSGHPGYARRDAFIARLAAHGSLRLACIDLTVAACLDAATQMTELPTLRGEAHGAAETVANGHTLRFIEVHPSEARPTPGKGEP